MKPKLIALALALSCGAANAVTLTTTFIASTANNVGLITTTQSGSLANAVGTINIFSCSTDLLAENLVGVTTLAGFDALLANDPGLVRAAVAFTNGTLLSSAATNLGDAGNRIYVWIDAGADETRSWGAYKGVLVPAVGALSLTSATLTDLGQGTSVYAATGTSGFQLASVPEPSAALLGALGALGLLRRRRI